MRYSKQRELVYDTVRRLADHPTADEVYHEAVRLCPGLSLGTVYRNLNGLTENGRVRRVSIPGQPDRFDFLLTPHSHIYCTSCGCVEDLMVAEEKLLPLLPETGWEVESLSLTVFGLCRNCRRETRDTREQIDRT